MKSFIIERIFAFKNAFAGLFYVIRTQKNAWIHALATLMVLFLAYWLKLSSSDWGILILTIGGVWTAEFINTALEAVVDLASPQKHPLAKVGKDVGAAAVLIAAGSSIAIGFLVLGPPLLQKLKALF